MSTGLHFPKEEHIRHLSFKHKWHNKHFPFTSEEKQKPESALEHSFVSQYCEINHSDIDYLGEVHLFLWTKCICVHFCLHNEARKLL